MADEPNKQEKTEDATPRRREEAREQGQVALSSELMAATALVAGFGALLLGGGQIAQATGELVAGTVFELRTDALADIDAERVTELLGGAARTTVLALAGIVAPLFLIVGLTGYAQAGIRITPKALAWNPNKLNPVENAKKLLSTRTAVRTAAAAAKILVIATTMLIVAWGELPHVAALGGADVGPLLVGMSRVAVRCTIAALVAILALAVVDYLYQKMQHEKDLRMTKKELRDEMKNTEGDPQLKGRIRQVQREMARSRMMQEVPKATVVVTNPTHYAVALRYEQDEDKGRAPRVVAKGVDHVAQRIKEVAREAEVPLYEDVPLARALHAGVEIGGEIPETYYQAVATVLAYVYRIRKGEAAA